jgi:Secretion system C-terminal sorting domain
MPNPANSVATVKFISQKESEVTLRLIDNIGKVVLQHTQRATKGENKIMLTGLNKFSAGVYTLQLKVNDEIVTQKLILN